MIEYVAIILIVMIATIAIVGIVCDFRNIKLQNQNVEKLEEEVYKYLRHDDPVVNTDDEEVYKEPKVKMLDDKETIRILNGQIKNLEEELKEAYENLDFMRKQIIYNNNKDNILNDHIKILQEMLERSNEKIEFLQKQKEDNQE